MDNEKREKMAGEDYTKYGEFISSFHHWIPIEEQKEIAKNLENMTKDNEFKGVR